MRDNKSIWDKKTEVEEFKNKYPKKYNSIVSKLKNKVFYTKIAVELKVSLADIRLIDSVVNIII